MGVEARSGLAAHLATGCWALALLVGAVSAPPWTGWAAFVFAAFALLADDERARIGGIIAGAGLLLQRPDVVVGGLLTAAVVLANVDSWQRDKRLALSGIVGVTGVLVVAKQTVASSVLPAAIEPVVTVVWFTFVLGALFAAVEDARAGVRGLLLSSMLAVVSGAWFTAQLPGLPLDAAAHAVDERAASRSWPGLRDRAITALAAGAPAGERGVTAVMRSRPTDRELGTALVEAWGAPAAIEAGWHPTGLLRSEIAVQAAWALDERGQLGRAVQLLREQPRQGEVAWVLSTLAGELGDTELAAAAHERGVPPAVAVRAPGVVAEQKELVDGSPESVLVDVMAPVSTVVVRARGQSWNGDAQITVLLGGQRLGPLAITEAGLEQRWPVELGPGGYRLQYRLSNDARGVGGDRNIYDLVVEFR